MAQPQNDARLPKAQLKRYFPKPSPPETFSPEIASWEQKSSEVF